MGIIKTLNRKFLKMKDLSSFKKNLSLTGKRIIITGCNSGIGLSLIKKTFSLCFIKLSSHIPFTLVSTTALEQLIACKQVL